MSNLNAIKTISEIQKIAKKLKYFTYEQLIKETYSIPDSSLKFQCIEWFLMCSEIEQILGVYHYFN